MIRHRPYSLILFDEIEKAHPEVFNMLLQLLDNGRLTDGKGRVVNFRNTIIIMTSNVGSQHFKALARIGFGTADGSLTQAADEEAVYRDKVMESLRRSFRPEFLNRIDDIVIFHPLREEDIESIVDIQLRLVESRLKDRRISLTVDKAVRAHLAKEGFDAEYGARPLRRLIQKVIVDTLADKIIRGDLKDGGTARINYRANSLVFTP
jgi:ATP-dependent Clp protease ATP-binding subunit ClpC